MEIKIVIKFCLGDSDCEGVVFIGEKHALISLQLKTGGILGYNYYDSPWSLESCICGLFFLTWTNIKVGF